MATPSINSEDGWDLYLRAREAYKAKDYPEALRLCRGSWRAFSEHMRPDLLRAQYADSIHHLRLNPLTQPEDQEINGTDLALPFWERGRLKLADALRLELVHPQVQYGRLLGQHVVPGCRWLEVGCGRQIVPDWAASLKVQQSIVSRAKWIVGMDVDRALQQHPLLTFKVNGFASHMPFRDESFGLVSANMVVEHIEDPMGFLAEVHRILRPQGSFIFHTTNFSNWCIFTSHLLPEVIKRLIIMRVEKRKAADVFPTHYRMNTPGAIRNAAAGAGFSVAVLRFSDSVGLFSDLGPAGWFEVLAAKLTGSMGNGVYRSNIICVLRRN